MSGNSPVLRSRILVAAAAASVALAPTLAHAQALLPHVLNHQGRAFDASMHPLAGTHSMKFALYHVAEGGTEIWSETHAILFDDGFYSTSLGNSSGIPPNV